MEATLDKDGFDKDGRHRIHNAAEEGDVKAIQAELNKGVSVDLKTKDRAETPLSWAAMEGHLEAMKMFISRKANVNATDTFNWTPLICAAYNGKVEAVKLLLEHKADINVWAISGDRQGKTALEI